MKNLLIDFLFFFVCEQDKALLCRTSQELEVDISDVNLSTLSKAFKLAARTRLKVTNISFLFRHLFICF